MRMPLLSAVVVLSLVPACRKKHGSKSPQPIPEQRIPTQDPSVNPPINPVGSELMLGCDSSNRQLLWGQMAVDSDLMQAFSAENSVSLADEKIAVVDSGLDTALASQFPGKLQYFSATDFPGAPDSDANGHGSFVAGLIAAQDVGLAPGVSLSSYKVAKPEGYPYSDVYLGIRKACADGNKLINVSQGFWSYERDPASEMKDFADTITELHKSGCIMIKAAGNDAFERKPEGFVAEDAVLQVEAASVSRSLSKFSSNGEVRAPGSLIASIKPMGAGPQSCEGQRYPATVSSGTSFAAPIVTGILAHVRAHLKKSAAFLQLSPEQQILVLHRIIKASEISALVNGYRAVVLARLWTPEMQTVEGMHSALLASCPAPAPVPSCADAADASSYLSCMAPVRRSLALCPQTLPKEAGQTFLEGLLAHNASDLWLSYAAIINRSETLQSTAAAAGKMLTKAMPAQFDSNNNHSWLEGLDVVAATSYLMATGTMTRDFLFQYTQSAALLDALNKSNGRDGRLRDRLKDQLASLVQQDADSLFGPYEAAYSSWSKQLSRKFETLRFSPVLVDSMGRIRFQTLLRSVTPEGKLSILDKIESDYFQRLVHDFNEMPRPISGMTPIFTTKFAEEDAIETWDGDVLSAFYQNRGLTIDLAGSVAQFVSFPASFVVAELAAERQRILDSKVYPKVSLFVIKAISQHVLWTKSFGSEDEVLRSAIMNLQMAITVSTDFQAQLQADFNAIADGATHAGFKSALLNPVHFAVGTGYIQNSDGSSISYPLSSIVGADIRRKMLLEILSEIPLQKPEHIVENATLFGYLLRANQDLLPKNTWQSFKAPAEWMFSEWAPSYKTRLDGVTGEPQTFRNTQGPTLPSLFNESLSAYLRAAALDIKTFNGYRPLMSAGMAKDLQRLDGYCQLADRPRLISDVDELLNTINTAPNGKFYQTMKTDLESFKTECLD